MISIDQNIVVYIILIMAGVITGTGKAVRDTIDHHWGRSVFMLIENDRVRQWFRSDWTQRPNHPLWFLWDGWHFSDTLSYASLLFLFVFAESIIHVALVAIVIMATFKILYHGVLLIHEDD